MNLYEILIESHKPNLSSTLSEIKDILEQNNIRFVLAGANALSIYSHNPRMTVDIDFFVDYEDKNKLENVLSKFSEYFGKYHSKFKMNGVEIDILYGGDYCEDYALFHVVEKKIFGKTIKTVSPEALLILYLNSEKSQNFEDAKVLVKSVDINFKEVQSFLKKNNLYQQLKKLKKVQKESKKVEPSYDEFRQSHLNK